MDRRILEKKKKEFEKGDWVLEEEDCLLIKEEGLLDEDLPNPRGNRKLFIFFLQPHMAKSPPAVIQTKALHLARVGITTDRRGVRRKGRLPALPSINAKAKGGPAQRKRSILNEAGSY